MELFLNGKSLGRQTMKPNWFLDWNAVYEPGVLSANGYDENGALIAKTKIETTGAPAEIQLSPDRKTVNADGEDCSIVNVFVLDKKGRVVPVADNLIHFKLSGPGKIIGVGNGDPSCHEPDKCEGNWQRSAFNGCAQVIVQTTRSRGTIKLTATADHLKTATVKIPSKRATSRPLIP
jgi:beta-galactosidase